MNQEYFRQVPDYAGSSAPVYTDRLKAGQNLFRKEPVIEPGVAATFSGVP